jgi:hypothetical protein
MLDYENKQRYFSTARESVMEYGALFDPFRALNHISSEEDCPSKIFLTQIGAMRSTLRLQ